MLTRLGLLLRRSYRAAAHLVPLGEELAFVLAYAEILERRYRDRVTLTVDVPDALRAHAVPAFSLQPLVENAFRHGVERREARTVVEIAGALRDGTLTLRVTDRPHGTSRWESSRELDRRRGGRAVRRDGDGVGLGNTRERLRALYGARAGLTLDRRPSETTATLWLPVSSGGDAGPAAEALASEMAAR
jgi:LytS/YehU family sensor histidine kinase